MNELMMVLEEMKEKGQEVKIYILNGFQVKGKITKYGRQFIVLYDEKSEGKKLIMMRTISTIEY